MSALALPIIAASGTLFSAGAQIAGGIAQSNAAEKNAALKNQQADELLAREAINEQMLRDQSAQSERGYGSLAAESGSSGIGGLLTIKKNLELNIATSRREADYKAKMLRAGADIDLALGSDAQTAGILTGAGTLLGGAAKAYDLYRGPTTSSSLPKGGK